MKVAAFVILAAAGAASATDCGSDLPLRATAAGNAAVSVAFGRVAASAEERARLPAHRHFELELQVCPAQPVAGLRVEADMPAHRHGMNYRTTVQALPAPGRFRAEGLLFHMSGRWRVIVDLPQPAGTLRLTHELEVP